MAVSAIIVGVVYAADNGPTVSASSTEFGTDAHTLIEPLPSGTNGARWRSDGETNGAWVDLTWPAATAVDHVRLVNANEPGMHFGSAVVTFDGGASLLATVDESGVADIRFPQRQVTTVRISLAGVSADATEVAIAAVDVGLVGGPTATAVPDAAAPVVSVSSPAASDGSALTDGDPQAGLTGAEWLADDTDAAPWVSLDWSEPRIIASAQIFGPSATAFDPGYSAAAPLYGELVFSDGSRVAVSGIAGGLEPPTTIAFTPRVTTSVRLELFKTITQAVIGLREFAVYDEGVTPPRQPVANAGYTVPPSAPSACGLDSVPFGQSVDDSLALVCPAPGSTVDGESTVVVQGKQGTLVDLTAWHAGAMPEARGSEVLVASSTVDANGLAEFTFSSTDLPHGPVNLKVTAHSSPDAQQPLYVQLFNEGGVALDSPSYAPTGMSLQWDEEFADPLSVSYTGQAAIYGATKPAYWGTSEFGAAQFPDPALGSGTLATTAGDYLRIRVTPNTDLSVTPHEYIGGMLSSLHVGSSGFAAQYGYYEARILGAPGLGTWPAFWMLDTESTTKRSDGSGEVDAVELYGHATSTTCHAVHNWVAGADDGTVRCLSDSVSDWAMSWHTYGVQVGPGGASYYLDGVRVLTLDGLLIDDTPYFFMLNLAMDGGWPVDLRSTGNVADMYVDWVHVYT